MTSPEEDHSVEDSKNTQYRKISKSNININAEQICKSEVSEERNS